MSRRRNRPALPACSTTWTNKIRSGTWWNHQQELADLLDAKWPAIIAIETDGHRGPYGDGHYYQFIHKLDEIVHDWGRRTTSAATMSRPASSNTFAANKNSGGLFSVGVVSLVRPWHTQGAQP